ncbi:hypothetical protein HRR83_008683 [Exophiala dermatitidis]|uniref:Survival Motor Neuron Gemin2-binding domain-containing protein n=1 Tax=Exophiala dermatitidis TaxID=5970 RepID=A0AAN6ERJ2_EXODE|nr:hypothetical protein HRR73_008498 [Exophiala dermatitidis]KAJ4505684.1 hypothetical protein HRR74_008595 [Exophiala dermatitidis]KAJ4536389.1 hypothetical protein HRR77_007309 [Exophiala dermatitidis]KAJ4538682.1 hypothetical protein HRR78_008019 [Exophiala dermatitidis]KAJ4541082.1 hypothetical protein HRR76_004459 [Exophiala dermatitidis]
MPKNKKAKTKHYPSKNSAELSQAEIWDDSALIRSWNDAVAEYEYYHSIHARGEDVEEILRKAEMDELAENGTGALSTEWQQVNSGQTDPESDARPISSSTAVAPGATATGKASPESQEDGEIEDGELEDDLEAAKEALSRKVLQTELSAPQVPAETPAEQEISQHVAENMVSQVPLSSANKPKPMIRPSLPPAAVEGPSAEQTLENIKMAYYWAGYYSGLYDGQRQAQASAPPPPQPQP